MELKDLLKVMVDKDGSDLFLSTGAPPSMKAHGRLVPMTDKVLPPGYTRKIANQALDRIINFFPEERHKQLYLDLSLNLRGFVSQRLVKTPDGKRAAAIEILLGTPRVADLIKNGKVEEIKEVMEKSENIGMKTFDSALFDLYRAGKISLEKALKNADSENNLRLKISLAESERGKGVTDEEASGGLSLTPKQED